MACDKSINCVNPDDFPDISSETVPLAVNGSVSTPLECLSGYATSLPAWITYDSDSATLTGAAGFWSAETVAEANAIAEQQLQDFVDALFASFFSGSCDVVIAGDSIDHGGDTFDCYPENEDFSCLPLAGTGWGGGWRIGPDPFRIWGDDFDPYVDQNPLLVPLTLGDGFDGGWLFTLPDPPDAPSGLTATTISYEEIDIEWVDNSSNEDGFQIERKTGAGGTYATIHTTAANVTTYSDSGLTDDTTYFYRVKAISGVHGDSAYSNEASATTDEAPPGPPTAGLILWLDASAITGLSDNDPVSTWEDQTLSGNDATGAGTYKTNVFGTEPAVLLNGSTDFFTLGSTISTATDGPFSFIVVAKKEASGTFCLAGHSSTSMLYRHSATPDENFFIGGSNNVSSAYSSLETALTCNSTRRSTSTLEFDENNSDRGTAVRNNGFDWSRVGSRNTTSERWNGYICEVLFYNAYLSDAEYSDLYTNYLKPKWGLP